MTTYRVIGTDGREYGPVEPEQLRDWIGAGRVTASTLVCVQGSLDWKPLGTLSMLWFSSESATRCLRELEREFGAGGRWTLRMLAGTRFVN